MSADRARLLRLLRRGGLLWWAIVLAVATISVGAAYAAFSARTQNTGNQITSGTVALSDNDSGTAMLSLSNAALGATDTSCIRTTFGGTLASSVRHHAAVAGTLAPYLTLKVTRGSGAGTFDSCTGFTADTTNYTGAGAGVIYDGNLSSYPTSYAAAIVDPTDNGSGSYAGTISAVPSLVNYWRLGDTSPSTTAVDIESANNGTYTNGPTLGVAGAPGGGSDTAVQFDGVNDYVTATRQIADDFSIEFWFKSTQGLGTDPRWSQGAGMVDGNVSGTNNDFGVSLRSDGRVVAGVGGSSDVSIVSTNGGYDDGGWHHVVFTREKATRALNLYVDGSSAATGTGSTTASLTSPANLNFGRLASAANYFAGTLDEVATYNTVLSGPTVAAHASATSTTPETWTTGETHDYKFQITLQNNVAAKGKSATATFTFQAASQ